MDPVAGNRWNRSLANKHKLDCQKRRISGNLLFSSLMRLLPASVALFGMLLSSLGQNAPRLIWQPVQEYFIHQESEKEAMPISGTRRLNSFTSYTHLGTDFGFMGPAEHDIEWVKDEVLPHLGQEPDAWAGMWHSLAGLAREPQKFLDFTAAWPDLIQSKYQTRISCVRVDAHGYGRIRLEIKSDNQQILWSAALTVPSAPGSTRVFPVSPLTCKKAKLINWIAEPGSEITVDGLFLGIEAPDVPFDEYVIATSYAKLARCFDSESGFVKDRAHLEDGAFESLASTGMFALATVAVSQPPLEIVSPEQAQKTLNKIYQAVKALDRPLGVLPHFVRRTAMAYAIHPGTEFSTVDTAIFYHSLLLGAEILQDNTLKDEVVSAVDQIDFDKLRLPDGVISHGVMDDGHTLLPHGWKDWGGETALVMMLQNIVNENAPRHKMERPGQAWQGSGFIPELQSLFYPDFDSDEPDALDGVKWFMSRHRMLKAQRDYVTRTWPGSMAAKLGLYGLSAGEGPVGKSYYVGGVDLPDQAVLHPHYILMSAALTEPPATYALLRRLEKAKLFPPWGMVETVPVNCSSYLPMNGSLNAGFEALGAYHLFAKSRGVPNAIYSASRHSSELRRAAQVFFPMKQAQSAQTKKAAE